MKNPEWGIGPFPWRVTPFEWFCKYLLKLPLMWVYRRWPDAYLWLASRAYTAEALPEMRREWKAS